MNEIYRVGHLVIEYRHIFANRVYELHLSNVSGNLNIKDVPRG